MSIGPLPVYSVIIVLIAGFLCIEAARTVGAVGRNAFFSLLFQKQNLMKGLLLFGQYIFILAISFCPKALL